MEGLVIALIRVAGSLPVLRWAFVGGLIAVFIDLSDLFLRQAIDLGGLSNYQEWDKWVDQVYIWLFLIVALQWSGWERRVALGLFGWRFIGFLAFAAGAGREVLIFFPHVFEFWFLFVAARPHWPAKLRPGWAEAADGTPAPLTRPEAIRWLLFLAALKIFHEYTLHTGKWFDRCSPIEFFENLSDCIGPV
ncbi:MAG: hypothetical protein F4038_02225 [Chloroflexi bacterium]|nr:hypothetical protein [Chloroflexota bacterium]MYA01506.1 hypothetical protein [Chloroflexota bacterium]MYD53322.1 hypothetical protein [Chloroflexota bacterium]MYJ91857.1 hypothetical protein [Chloroflexota bacterium]